MKLNLNRIERACKENEELYEMGVLSANDYVQLSREVFLENFSQYDVNKRESEVFQYALVHSHNNRKYICVITEKELIAIEEGEEDADL